MSPSTHSRSNTLLIGLLLVILGVLFLGDSFHFFNFGHVIADWWPLILIAIGLLKLNKHEHKGGVTLLIIGGLFLLAELNIFSWHQLSRLWPVVLIVIGIGMLLRRTPAKDHTTDFAAETADKFELNAMFSNLERKVTSQQFRGGEVNAIFGNLKLDLRNTKIIAEGAILTADAVFGSIDIYVPPEMAINFQCSQFLGRADNNANTAQTGPELTLKGDAVFGNIRVSN